MSRAESAEVLEQFRVACAEVGFDLVHAFGVGHYNASVAQAHKLEGWGSPNALGLLVGNTRRLWPVFLRACANDVALAALPDPLDAYTERSVTRITARLTTRASNVTFAHATAPRAYPIQRLAEQVGFAAVSPSHLAIHPLHGPWIALRAVVVVDLPGPDALLQRAEAPCRNCSAPCLPAFERALLVSGQPLSSSSVAAHADDWIAVRDACPIGRASRYGIHQTSYHYAPTPSKLGLAQG